MSTLERLKEMASQLVQAELRVQRATDELDAAKAVQRQLAEEAIPGVLDDLGITEMRLSDGAVLKVEESLKAHISKENTPAAMAWMRENGFANLIKTEVIVTSKDPERIRLVRQVLAQVPFKAGELDNKEGVHHSTLRAWAKRRLAAGEELPPSVTTFRRRVAKLVTPDA